MQHISTYEAVGTALSVLTLLTVWVGLVFTYRQIRAATEQLRQGAKELELVRASHADNHEWNRRITALNYSFTDDPDVTARITRLDKHLKLGERRKAEISMDEIRELEEEAYPEIRADMQFVLGRFENMFVAIQNNIADEQVCKDMISSRVVLYYRFFRAYIDDVRSSLGSNRIYECFERYARRWDETEPLNQRSSTGDLSGIGE